MKPGRNHSLDLLRVVAAGLVFLYHYESFAGPTPLSFLARYGWAGVDLFFVLSGYLIADKLLKPLSQGEQPSYKEFYARRALRILPSYLAVLLLYFFIPGWREFSFLPPLAKFATFTLNLGWNYGQDTAFATAWSLCVEEHFYLLLPLAFLAFSRTKRHAWIPHAIGLIFLAGLLIRFGSWLQFVHPEQLRSGAYYRYIYFPTYTRLDGLLVGVTIALAQRFKPRTWHSLSKRANAILFFGIILLALTALLCARRSSFAGSVFGFPLIAAGFGCFVIAGLSPYSVLSKLNIPGATTLALLSYPFYLTHIEVIHLLREYPFAWTISACVGVASALHFIVEAPFLQYSRTRAHQSALDVNPCL